MKGFAKINWKWTRIGILAALGTLLVLALAVTTGTARETSVSKAGYVGSKVCFGCHSGKYNAWTGTGHAQHVTQVLTSADLPADPSTAADDLKSELNKAAYVVAGQRFIARDSKTGQLTYLNVVYDKAAQKYVPTKGGSSWETGCAGCHTTGLQKDKDISGVEMGISCEACHGPGRDHVLGKGDKSKIVVSTDSMICGRCHNKGKSDDGTGWPAGLQPTVGQTMDFASAGYHLNPPSAIPSGSDRQYGPLMASGHGKALADLNANDHANANCYTCHSTEARSQAKHGTPITDMAELKSLTDNVSCVACHGPHGKSRDAQLNEDPKTLCISCHTSSLPEGTTLKVGQTAHHSQKELFLGYGAIGIDPSPAPHLQNGVTCYQCHMTGGNHSFKVILPSMVKGTNQKDSCTSCHTGSSASIRGAYLELWQSTVKDSLAAVQARIDAANAVIKAKPDLATSVTDNVKIATSNISLITADKSGGAHNFDYAMKILDDAAAKLTAFEAATK